MQCDCWFFLFKVNKLPTTEEVDKNTTKRGIKKTVFLPLISFCVVVISTTDVVSCIQHVDTNKNFNLMRRKNQVSNCCAGCGLALYRLVSIIRKCLWNDKKGGEKEVCSEAPKSQEVTTHSYWYIFCAMAFLSCDEWVIAWMCPFVLCPVCLLTHLLLLARILQWLLKLE